MDPGEEERREKKKKATEERVAREKRLLEGSPSQQANDGEDFSIRTNVHKKARRDGE